MIRVAVASDIHGYWDVIEHGQGYPKADLLLLAGDLLSIHSFDQRENGKQQLKELSELDSFMGSLIKEGRYGAVVYVAGNHEFAFQYYPDEARRNLKNIIYLQDEKLDIGSLCIYGSPWQPWFGGWAFNFPRIDGPYSEAAIRKIKGRWSHIPKETNILVTHTPPRGILDTTYTKQNVGCPFLRSRIDTLAKKRNLFLHVFGHIHYSSGIEQHTYKLRKGHEKIEHTLTFANAAICAAHDAPTNPIKVFQF